MALPKVKKVQSLFSAHEMGFFWVHSLSFSVFLVSDKNFNENLGGQTYLVQKCVTVCISMLFDLETIINRVIRIQLRFDLTKHHNLLTSSVYSTSLIR